MVDKVGRVNIALSEVDKGERTASFPQIYTYELPLDIAVVSPVCVMLN